MVPLSPVSPAGSSGWVLLWGPKAVSFPRRINHHRDGKEAELPKGLKLNLNKTGWGLLIFILGIACGYSINSYLPFYGTLTECQGAVQFELVKNSAVDLITADATALKYCMWYKHLE